MREGRGSGFTSTQPPVGDSWGVALVWNLRLDALQASTSFCLNSVGGNAPPSAIPQSSLFPNEK